MPTCTYFLSTYVTQSKVWNNAPIIIPGCFVHFDNNRSNYGAKNFQKLVIKVRVKRGQRWVISSQNTVFILKFPLQIVFQFKFSIDFELETRLVPGREIYLIGSVKVGW